MPAAKSAYHCAVHAIVSLAVSRGRQSSVFAARLLSRRRTCFSGGNGPAACRHGCSLPELFSDRLRHLRDRHWFVRKRTEIEGRGISDAAVGKIFRIAEIAGEAIEDVLPGSCSRRISQFHRNAGTSSPVEIGHEPIAGKSPPPITLPPRAVARGTPRGQKLSA